VLSFEVEDAAIVIEEAGYEITKFLLLHHRGLGYREEECNRLMGILDDYTNIMAGCVPAESYNHPLRKPIKDYFKKLDTLLGKENFTECTKWNNTVGSQETLELVSHLKGKQQHHLIRKQKNFMYFLFKIMYFLCFFRPFFFFNFCTILIL
ncbi:hypothetical protein AB205_0119020, partial [Aquarana catesbeiana]